MGHQMGRLETDQKPRPWGTMFFQDLHCLQAMWRRIEHDTGILWNVEVAMVDLSQWGMEHVDYAWGRRKPGG